MARMGSLSANEERFMAWRTIDGKEKDPLGQFGELETLVMDHNLMQAIARVNRVFKDKPGGLVVDYIGIANEPKQALKERKVKGRDDQRFRQKRCCNGCRRRWKSLGGCCMGWITAASAPTP